jgi:hypothetical protein
LRNVRHAKKAATIWVQNDFCARVKGASDDAPVTYEDPVTEEKTTHGTADGRKACLHHCLSLGVAGVDWSESAGSDGSAVRYTCRGQPNRR